MKKLIFALFFMFLSFSSVSVYADVLGPKTDAAVAKAVDKGQDALSKVIDETVNMLKDGKDLVVKEAPKVIIEFIHWKIASNIIDLFLCVVCFIAASLFFKWLLSLVKKKDFQFEENPLPIFGFAVSAVVMLISFVAFFHDLSELAEIIFAPKIYVLEHIAQLIKHGNLN